MKKQFKLIFSFLFIFLAMTFANFSPQFNIVANASSSTTIFFNPQGGVCSVISKETNQNGTLDSLPVATNDNYHFVGWFVTGGTEPVTAQTIFESNTTLYAHWIEKDFSYTISNNNTFYKLVSTNQNSLYNETITTTATSLYEIIELIKEDSKTSSNTITLNFENLTVNESPIELDFDKLLFTGKITNTAQNELFIFNPAQNLTIEFNNFSATFNNHSIFATIPLSNYSKNIRFINTSISSLVSNSYFLQINDSNYEIAFAEKIYQTCSYLFNYTKDIILNFDTILNNASNIKIALPYNLANNVYITSYYAGSNNFNFVSQNPSYFIETNLNQTTLTAKAVININFDAKEGITNTSTLSYDYLSDTLNNFIPDSDVSFAYGAFDGWFATITFTAYEQEYYNLSNDTYYFDIICLENFIINSGNISDIDEYFETSLNNFSITSSFSSYKYDSFKANIEYFIPTELMLSLNKTPTFSAKWAPYTYVLSFNTNGGTAIDDIYKKYNEPINEAITEKIGYTFAGWFSNSILTDQITFPFTITKNTTIYAKWNINNYTINYVYNKDNITSSQNYNFAETITHPNISSYADIGWAFDDWYLDEEFNTKFELQTMPAENLTLYAKWIRKKYNVIFNTAGLTSIYPTLSIEYGQSIPIPKTPTAIGYTFLGWYQDKNYVNEFLFESMPAKNITIFAKWQINKYTITLISITGNLSITQDYNSSVSYIAPNPYPGYKFDGWYTSSDFTYKYEFSTMPANDITLYAKWTQKQTMDNIFLETQTIKVDSNSKFVLPDDLKGCVVEYKVNNVWTTEAPTKIGKYDIKISKAETADYLAFSQIFENAFVIEAKNIDVTYLIVLFIALFLLEILAIIIIKRARFAKLNHYIGYYSIALPFGVIEKTQFILLIITGILALFGFIWVVYELVKLHKTVPIRNEDIKYDNSAKLARIEENNKHTNLSAKVDEYLQKKQLSNEQKKDINNEKKVDND